MIADQVLPRLTVTAREFKWDEHAKASMFQAPSTLVGRKGSPNEVEFTAEEKTSSVADYGLEADLFSAVPELIEWHRLVRSLTEAVLLIARLFRRFDFHIEDAAAVRPAARLTTRPAKQIMVRVAKA